ncbi:MAG: hypothetical protein ISR48_03005 [Alphaproteobacteria bacterium]|nr:hypothetical protein [Alphaproteobacteria bacterium]
MNKGSRPKEIAKSLNYRVRELTHALSIIRDSLSAVRNGKIHQLIPMYGQLRALLYEKSRKHRPLLLSVAEELSQPLTFYCMPNDPENRPPQENLLLHLRGAPFSIHQQLTSQTVVELEEFLDLNLIYFKEKDYPVSEIIKLFAEKAGGAHYPHKIPEDFANLLSFELYGQKVVENYFCQIAEIVFQLGVGLVQKISEMEVSMVFYLPAQKITSPKFIVDLIYANTPMRINLCIHSGSLIRLGIVDLRGCRAEIGSNQRIDFDKPHYVSTSFNIKDDLTSELVLYIDGEVVGRREIDEPFEVRNDFPFYEQYYNRAAIEDEIQPSLKIGIAEIMTYGTSLTLPDRGKLFHYMEQDLNEPEKKYIWFSEDSYGHIPSGKRDMKMEGEVIQATIQEHFSK